MSLILALGNSLTAGYGLPAAQAYPARLEALLQQRRPGSVVLNAGVSGDTAGMVLARLPRVLMSLSGRPDLAIVEVGPNDVIRGHPAHRTRADVGGILDELTGCGIAVLLATLVVPPMLARRAAGFEGLLEEVAAGRGVPVWPFAPPSVLGNPAMLLADSFHPDARAMNLIAVHLLPAVMAELDKLDAARSKAS